MLRRALLLTSSLALVAVPVAADAQPLSRTDQVVPDEPPAPVFGLLAHLPGVPAATAAPGVSVAAGEIAAMTGEAPDPVTGPFLRFAPGRGAAERLVVATPTFLRQTPVAGRTAAWSGVTLSLWYRHPTGAPLVGGWNPIVFAGHDDADDWAFGLVLEDGVPTVIARRAFGERFGVELGGGGSPLLEALDDEAWHHIAIRLSRPGCTADSCPSAGRALATLVVDGNVVDEAVLAVDNDLDTVFTGSLHVEDAYENQNNFAGMRLNTIADLDELRVHAAALSLAEIRRFESTRPRGLRFQIPPLEPSALGWSGPSPQVGALPATGLPSRQPGGAGSVSLLALGAVPVGEATVASGLRGLGSHTFMAWIKLEPGASGGILGWTPVAGAGWTVEATASGLQLRCNGTQATTALSLPRDGAWRLLVVTADGARVEARDAFLRPGGGLACPAAAAPAGAAPRLELLAPAGVTLAWAALYAGARPRAEVAAIARPGPALWLNEETRAHRTPDAGGPVVIAPDNNKTRALRELKFGREASNPDRLWQLEVRDAHAALQESFTLSFTVKVDKVDPAEPFVVIGGRRAGARGEAKVWINATGADREQGFLVVEVSEGGALVPFRLRTPLDLKRELHVSVAWPLERVLTPGPGLSGATVTVREPGITVGGVFMNRRYATDEDPLLREAPRSATPPAPGTLDRWHFGNPEAPPQGSRLRTEYKLGDLRVHPRPLVDAAQVGMRCSGGDRLACADGLRRCETGLDDALGSGFCGGCDSSAFDAGGVSPFDRDCMAELAFHERCEANVMCASGRCAGGVCVASTLTACEAGCGAIGRTCKAIAGGFDCDTCRPGFTPVPGTDAASPTAVCTWSPTLGAGAACVDDGQCLSGACREHVIHEQQELAAVTLDTVQRSFGASKNGVCNVDARSFRCNNVAQLVPAFSTRLERVTRKVCLAEHPSECEASPLFASAQAQTTLTALPNGSQLPPEARTRYLCDGRASGACRPNFARANGVLSPGACQVAAARALTQEVSGTCEASYRFPQCEITRRPTFAFPQAPYTAWGRNEGLSLRELKLLFLGEDAEYRPAIDYARLRDAGVGPLLIAYAGADAPTRAAMVREHGAFEPLSSCAATDATGAAYQRDANFASCAPALQRDGARCPPSGTESLGLPPGDYCRSAYCSRDDGLCERGDNPLRELRPSAGNQNRSGKASVKFGLVRVDSTEVEMKRPPGSGPVTAETATDATNADRAYEAWVSQSHVLCILGRPFPDRPLFETRLHLLRQGENACSKTEVSTFVMGLKLTGPAPGPIAGSCTSFSPGVNDAAWDACKQPFSCEPVDPAQLASVSTLAQWLVPAASFCAPTTDESGADLLPELRKDFKEFLVPLYVSFGPTLDLCLEYSVGMDATGMPQFVVRPSVGLGVEAKAALGSAETSAYEIGFGVRLALKVLELAFPITWGFELKDALDPAGKAVFGLLELDVIQKLALELSVLSGEFGLFASFAIGPFALEWTLNIFTWAGIERAFDLANGALLKTKLDFTARFANALGSGAAAAQCQPADSSTSSPCYR
jgi:hypothetical protein